MIFNVKIYDISFIMGNMNIIAIITYAYIMSMFIRLIFSTPVRS